MTIKQLIKHLQKYDYDTNCEIRIYGDTEDRWANPMDTLYKIKDIVPFMLPAKAPYEIKPRIIPVLRYRMKKLNK